MNGIQFLFNAEFDFELRNPSVSPQIQTAVESMAPLFSVGLTNEDSIFSQSHNDSQFDEYLSSLGIEHAQLIPFSQSIPEKLTEAWGWSASAVAQILMVNGKIDAPTPEVCRVVNSRQFAHNINEKHKLGAPHSQVINTMCELHTAMLDVQYTTFVLKPFFGNSGAGFLFISANPTVEELGKAESLINAESVIFEPWLERTCDIASLFRISSSGTVEIIGHHLNICNNNGAFYGTMISNNIPEITTWKQQIELMIANVSEELFSVGYFGLVSIDSFSYIESNEEKIALCVDINCRYTMSYIAHMLFKKLKVPAIFYRFIAKKRHQLPDNFHEFINQLGHIHYSAETKEGVFIASPLRITGSDGVNRQPLRSAFCIAGKTIEEILQMDELLRSRVLRTKQ